jgi:hypothetical protein
MAIEKLENISGTCQLMNAVDNPIPLRATFTHFGFQNPCGE